MQEEIIKDIRKRCRMAMNGVISASMREKGISYKLNFGLTLQQIKDIARRYEADVTLAETLWQSDTRELKILSSMLYPTDAFSVDTANRWVREIPNQEIREQVCINLLQHLSFASELADDWANQSDTSVRTTGYWLLARLLVAKKTTVADIDKFANILTDAVSEDILLRNAAQSALKQTGRQSKEMADTIINRLSIYKDNPDLIKREAYDSILFEFEYYFGE